MNLFGPNRVGWVGGWVGVGVMTKLKQSQCTRFGQT